MDRNNIVKANIAGIVFALLTGFSLFGIKTCMVFGNTMEILLYRFDFALAGTLIVILFRHRRRTGAIKKNRLKLLIPAGSYIGFMALQTLGLFFSTSITAAVIFAAAPVFVQILAVFVLNEKTTSWQKFFIAVSVAALIFMVTKGVHISIDPAGVILMFFSCLCMSFNNVSTRYMRNEFTPFEFTAAIVILGCIVTNAAALIYGLHTGTLSDFAEPLHHLSFIISTAYLGICCIIVSAVLMSYMQANLHAVNASVFGNVSTAVSIIAGAVLLDEQLKMYQILCSIVIIAAVIGISKTEKHTRVQGGQ